MGFEMYSILVIHPICVIEEYAIMDRSWVWFIPIIPPRSAFSPAVNRINNGEVEHRRNAKMVKGASFCHVANSMQVIHGKDIITDGNQKWNGAMPSFNMIEEINKIFIWWIEFIDHWDILVISIILEPIAWAIKYLMEASVS